MNSHNNVERVMACPTCLKKLRFIERKLTGKTVESVEFTNEIDSVGILLHFDDGDTFLASAKELRLTELLRDPDIGRQEQYLYEKTLYRPMKRRRQKKGTNSDAKET